MNILPQQLEMFVASQIAESLGGKIPAWELNLLDQPNRLWYAIRMPGGVGGLLSDGESYPDVCRAKPGC